jgi:hypothetical protein
MHLCMDQAMDSGVDAEADGRWLTSAQLAEVAFTEALKAKAEEIAALNRLAEVRRDPHRSG